MNRDDLRLDEEEKFDMKFLLKFNFKWGII